MKSEPRIGNRAYLSPGIGFSGGTLGRDLKVLDHFNRSSSSKADFFGYIHESNKNRKHIIIDKIKKLSGHTLLSKNYGVLGLTYKPGTSTLRRSLPVEIIELLIKEGAKISVFDPKANFGEWQGSSRFKKLNSAEELVKESNFILLLTEWPEFRSLKWKALINKEEPQIIFDTKNFLSDLNLDRYGYQYIRIGKGSSL
jgi:UDPglucose 6-dehydrogenase